MSIKLEIELNKDQLIRIIENTRPNFYSKLGDKINKYCESSNVSTNFNWNYKLKNLSQEDLIEIYYQIIKSYEQ